MNLRAVSARFLLLTIAAMLVFASCGGDDNGDSGDSGTEDPAPTEASSDSRENEDATPTPEETTLSTPGEEAATPTAESGDGTPEENATEEQPAWVDYETEVLATNLDIPWQLVFLPNGDVFITERPGQVRLFRDGQLLEEPILEFDDVVHERGGEGGLLGMVLHPEFEQNGWIYFYYTYLNENDEMRNRVVRYVVDGTEFSDRTVIIEDIPGAFTHNGGRIAFGPDDKLYVTVGDAQQQDFAQDPNVLVGKILRLNDDGSIPKDNPFEDSPTYAMGLRNPQGLSWHPETGDLYANQHGPSGHDAVFKIEPGANYGWPDLEGFEGEQKEEFTLPVMASGTDTWAPSGSTFVKGDTFPQWQNHYIMSGLRSVTLYAIDFSGEEPEMNPIIQGTFGRLRTVVEGPDGYLYVLTSNRDGRQEPAPDDDKLFRIIPAE